MRQRVPTVELGGLLGRDALPPRPELEATWPHNFFKCPSRKSQKHSQTYRSSSSLPVYCRGQKYATKSLELSKVFCVYTGGSVHGLPTRSIFWRRDVFLKAANAAPRKGTGVPLTEETFIGLRAWATVASREYRSRGGETGKANKVLAWITNKEKLAAASNRHREKRKFRSD
jgi:hypothetical protein